MKKIWSKLPAWLQAILLNLILLFPVIIAVQLIVQANLQSSSEWGWGLILTVLILAGYWYLVKRFNKFDQAEDIKLELTFSMSKASNWLMILGLMCITPSVIQLTTFLFDVSSTVQTAYFEAFRAYGPGKAIPLMLAMALTAGVVEEITYRGFMQNTLNRKYQWWLSILLIAVIFTIMHLLPLPLVLPYMIISVMFSLVAEKTKSTGVVIFAHVLVDFVLFTLIYYEATSLTQVHSSVIMGNLVLLIVGILVLFYYLNSSKRTLLSLRTS